jgi:CRISPR-associated protein Cas5t
MSPVALYVSAPIVAFRVPQAREYFETLLCPPPSTVYGMLLSLVGESNRLQHEGVEVALALLSEPERSVVLRTLWRVKSRKHGPGLANNRRPDFQELLTGIRIAVWVRSGMNEKSSPNLEQRLVNLLSAPASGSRFGGLCLGESTHLVDEVRPINNEDLREGWLLLSDPSGDLALPIWPDHVGSAGTRWGQYRLAPTVLTFQPPQGAWTEIRRPS